MRPFKAPLAEPPRLALPLQQAEDVALAHGALDVADDGAVRVVDELDADLGHVARVARAAEHAVDLRELDRRRVHGCGTTLLLSGVCGGGRRGQRMARRWRFGGAGGS